MGVRMMAERPAAMRILADENMPDTTVALLRQDGHDVHFVKETMPRTADLDVLTVATREGRLLVTQDKDFGDIVVNRNQPAPYGVVLFRFHDDVPDSDRFRLMASIVIARSGWGAGIWTVAIRHPRIG